ncbi:photoreceptor ankyrin repeat protein [Betta splendens]|uniref:Photoreceptor ankyrin repeat protein n=1 Tax=Betta splendens TaxID=158456 RepID=A0A6P7N3Z4_BETSP|nr:photoreceptor ankyrin repeat protein [Betta splendens]
MAAAHDDPDLGEGPSDDTDILVDDYDSESLFSEDSVLPIYEDNEKYTEPAKTLYEACNRNDPTALVQILERGVTRDEAMELDINGKNGLMVAVGKGFVDIVTKLHVCPLIDINHQDSDGNTALMIAAQAGFITILNYILNYYTDVDTEVQDPRGFTALLKAGMQGREDCVCALLMHGADINAMDMVQGRGLKDWVLRTGRFETLVRLRRLQAKPVAEQFCERYVLEWPELKQLVAKATAARTASQRLRQCLKESLTFSFPKDPQDDGVLDHMVRMTTSIHSPLVVTGCRPLCPTSPPEIGRRRFAVTELLEKYDSRELEESTVSHRNGSLSSASSTLVSTNSASTTSCCQDSQPTGGMRSFIPRSLAHRNSIFPSGCIPRIEVTKSTDPTPKKEKKKKKQKGYLEPPVWKYKEAKEEKKKEKRRSESDKKSKESKSKSRKK